MATGLYVLIAAVVLTVAFGVYRAAADGRFGRTRARSALDDTPWAGRLGEHATLVQFSSAFCAPCRVARRVLADVAEVTPGVVHLEIDAEQHLDVVRRLGVLRTPTTLVLDGSGVEVTRAAGAPTRAQVVAALGRLGS